MQKPPVNNHTTKKINDPTTDVLEDGWLHKVILLFQRPVTWSDTHIMGVGVFLALLVSLTWWAIEFTPRLSQAVFLQQLGFMALDVLMLKTLPKRKLSFGPWQPQLAALTVPRVIVGIVVAFVGILIGNRAGFAVLVGVQFFGTAVFYHGAFVEPFQLAMSEMLMFTDRLPVGVPSIRILHITDLHIERWTQREDTVLQIAAESKPDLIIITGDYVNTSYNQDPETYKLVHELLSQLHAPYGVYATLGSPPVDVRELVVPLFDKLNISLLRHDSHRIDFGDGRHLTLLGIDCTHDIPTDEARLAQLISRTPHDAPQLLVYHSPELMPQAAAQGIDLYMCGHTHGGQVRLPLIGPLLTSSQLGRRFVMGHYRLGRTHLYVSRGIGLEGLSAPRIRFMAPPEMTMVILMPSGSPETV